MPPQDELAELTALVRSGFPIILIETHEEPRILGLLEKLGNLENQPLFTWSISNGIRRLRGTERIPQSNELLDALKHIDKTPQNGLYVMCDAHPGFKDAVCVRLIREIALEHYKTARTLVFLSPRLEELPSEILRLAAHFRPALPDRQQIRKILSEEASVYESQSGSKARGDKAAIDMLVVHLLGMESEDVRRLIRQALRDNGSINDDDVRRVLRTKYEAMGGAGSDEFLQDSTNFKAVGGLARLKHWLGLRRKPFVESAQHDADRPKGIVLMGVQGGGKSLAARAVAGEWGVPLLRLDFGALYNKFQGETERNLRNALSTAAHMSPCVLWIDEIEKGLSTDNSENDGGVSRRVLGTLLTWMSERTHPVFVVATANDISRLPPELIRKGRFDEIFFVGLPNAQAREHIARIHLAKRSFDLAKFDITALASCSEGFSGAEIEQAIVSASFEARARETALTQAGIEEEMRRTRPLSVVMAEKLHALQEWAKGRAVFADEGDTAVSSTSP
ncbi:MAG: AAA family ATPase [Burkholderiales bacterium]